MLAISKLQDQFAYGDCATFALVLAEYYNYPIVNIHDADDSYIHSMLLYPDVTIDGMELYLDSYGIQTKSAIKNRYGLNKYFLYNSSKEELRLCKHIVDSLLVSAQVLLDRMLKDKLLPCLPTNS